MTKKDYELIASILYQTRKYEILKDIDMVCNRFSDELASKNPRFNKEKFLQACGVEVKDELGEALNNYSVETLTDY